MLLLYIVGYIIFLLIIWAFYAVARMHTLKFKNFSTHIIPVTNFLMIFLIVLSIVGFIVIFFALPENPRIGIIDESQIEEAGNNTETKSYKEEIIGNEYY